LQFIVIADSHILQNPNKDRCVRVATAHKAPCVEKRDKNSFCKGVRIREDVEITVENSAC
jgi:hypothetical protein